MKSAGVIGFSVAAIGIVIAVTASAHMKRTSSRGLAKVDQVADAGGNLHVPDGYRHTYEFLGTWAVAADQGQGAKELHNVYASRGATDAYRNDGKFPDGTVLVKEVLRAATKDMTTGAVSRADTLKGWFVMVKDDKGLYPRSKLWGDGWGWSWFDVANLSKTTSTNYRVDCLSCHVPAQASGWIYVAGYPPLKR
jgi:Cytochrome P460